MKNILSLPFLFIVTLFFILVSCSTGNLNPHTDSPTIEGCDVFPYDNIWNTPVDNLPVDANSDAYIATIGTAVTIHADFGAGEWEGAPIGIPFMTVDSSQALIPINYTYEDESDPGPFPIPPDAPIEGGPESTGDRHVIAIDTDSCTLYELYNAIPQTNTWDAESGAKYNLSSHTLRPAGYTSADAAGLPIFPGLVRYEEVAQGEIKHALRFTISQTQKAYVWPARHYASSLTAANYPPMGQRFRLKANYDISEFSVENQIILRALKKYGMMVADNGSSMYLSGIPDERWNNDDLHELQQVTASDFDAVDVSSLMIAPDSGQASQD
ncbi:MAG: hypothetical protein JXJ04_24090 [Spirochaetales bacterium]|nr:hypothetical protein [Spirochaetales bacterium]